MVIFYVKEHAASGDMTGINPGEIADGSWYMPDKRRKSINSIRVFQPTNKPFQGSNRAARSFSPGWKFKLVKVKLVTLTFSTCSFRRALQSIIVNVVSAINKFFTLCLMPKPVAAIYDPTENRIIDRKTDENVFPLYNSRKLPVVHFVHCDRVQSDLRRVQQYHDIIIISKFLPNGTLPQRSGPSCAIAPTCAILWSIYWVCVCRNPYLEGKNIKSVGWFNIMLSSLPNLNSRSPRNLELEYY